VISTNEVDLFTDARTPLGARARPAPDGDLVSCLKAHLGRTARAI